MGQFPVAALGCRAQPGRCSHPGAVHAGLSPGESQAHGTVYVWIQQKTTILVALFNAVLLLVSIGAIVYEAIQRMYHPAPLPGKIIAAVAAVGIVINAVTALLFFREKSRDLNVRSAYLHLMSDALVSAVIVAGGVLISFTGLYRIDAMLSILVAGVILYTS